MDTQVVGIVCGTRPEIIKLAPVYRALQLQPGLHPIWVHTAQHGEMAAHMLRCFEIQPDVQLVRTGTTLEGFSVECRSQLDELLAPRGWDMCIVQGDTESAFLGALAAFYARIPVAHVEAGLRTYNLARPFPEEGLRQMISRITQLHFAPTARARDALLREGIAADQVHTTGNTVVDAQRWICERHRVRRQTAGRGHILVTMHRREHWGGEMQGVFEAIADIAHEHPELDILFPVHLNPVVQKPARTILANLPNVRLTAPLDYLAMQQALADAQLVLTDSGGLQEEAPTFGVPLLVLRHETERPEAVEAGCAVLVGPNRAAIVREVRRLLQDELAYRRMQQAGNPFGDGQAAWRVARAIAQHLSPAAQPAAEPVTPLAAMAAA